MDTLAHGLTHAALGMGTRDRAPLRLQEGVAKYFEKCWRGPEAHDDHPSPDTLLPSPARARVPRLREATEGERVLRRRGCRTGSKVPMRWRCGTCG